MILIQIGGITVELGLGPPPVCGGLGAMVVTIS